MIETDCPVHLESSGDNLRGAHEIGAQRLFPLMGIPDKRFFQVPQYNTWIELMYNQNQKQILEYAKTLKDAGLPSGVLMIDEGWAPDYGDYDFCARKFSAMLGGFFAAQVCREWRPRRPFGGRPMAAPTRVSKVRL